MSAQWCMGCWRSSMSWQVAFNFTQGGVHAHSSIMGNQGKMAGNLKICIEILSQLFLPEFIYLMLSL